MKLPGPDHPISIEAHRGRVRVVFNGQTVAQTDRALKLQEASLPYVLYIPREDADMQWFERTSHATHCPYKGDASYFSLRVGERVSQNAVWSYEQPYPAMQQIAGHLAFYPSRVDAIDQA